MIGVLLGAFLINLLQQSLLRWLQISEFWVDAFLGMLILVAVTIDYVLMNRLRSWWGHTQPTTWTWTNRQEAGDGAR